MREFEEDLQQAVKVISGGGIILYPTDTIWGIGCDAKNESAINRIFRLKKRALNRSMIILVADNDHLHQYVNNPSPILLEFINNSKNPITAIYSNAKNLPGLLLGSDGSVAIRIPDDDFCQQLIKEADTPIVSTSANISGEENGAEFKKISMEIKNGVDYVVEHRRDEIISTQPSAIIMLNEKGKIEKLR
jgi:L-threonylcarbamoyladenylate synthase